MDMEAGTEEFVGSSNNDATVSHLVKGKRTKRQRPISPCATITCSSSSASGADYGSTTTYESTDQEEEDMANCLILLAQGQNNQPKFPATSKTERATATTAKIGFYTYECKTCNRTFPSFQALGGHRASHKKPKLTLDEKKPPTPPQLFEEAGQVYIKSTPQVSLGLAANGLVHSNKAKIHECSICGSEFTSGQALGGHMRRHRASATTSPLAIETSSNAVSTVRVKPRNILPLELDLNLPAPEEDLRDSKFQFTPTQKPLVLSAPSLVDCHY